MQAQSTKLISSNPTQQSTKEQTKDIIKSWKRKKIRSNIIPFILWLVAYTGVTIYYSMKSKESISLNSTKGIINVLLLSIMSVLIIILIIDCIKRIRKIRSGPVTFTYGIVRQKHSERNNKPKGKKQYYHFYIDIELDDGTIIEGVNCTYEEYIGLEEGHKVLVGDWGYM